MVVALGWGPLDDQPDIFHLGGFKQLGPRGPPSQGWPTLWQPTGVKSDGNLPAACVQAPHVVTPGKRPVCLAAAFCNTSNSFKFQKYSNSFIHIHTLISYILIHILIHIIHANPFISSFSRIIPRLPKTNGCIFCSKAYSVSVSFKHSNFRK